MEVVFNVLARRKLIASAGALALGLTTVPVGLAAERPATPKRQDAKPRVLEPVGTDLRRSIRYDELRQRYQSVRERAGELDVAPKRGALAGHAPPGELRRKTAKLRKEVRRAERAEARRRAAAEAAEAAEAAASSSGLATDEGATEPASGEGAAAGVSGGTLEAIAACESGGDPSAVNSAGYYGKYQFDIGTWQSVGGTGNPAEASEAEQDKRAAMLYAQSGSSPWPVCGG